jgi:ATP-dependent DNA ligase
MINMIASIHGDVIRTVGPVRHCKCEVLHTASDLIIRHKSLRCLQARGNAGVLAFDTQCRYDAGMLVRTPPSGFIEPCLPSTAERPPSGPDWIHEIKHDGYRLMALIRL